MAIWLVQGKTLQPVRRMESIVPLLPDNRESVGTQELFEHMHDTKLWLLCGCTKPDARMFTRKLADGRYALINHSEHGLHDINCPLATNVKGEAPERNTPDSTDGGAANTKQSEYRLLTPYKKVDLLAMDGIFEDDEKEPSVSTEEAKDGEELKSAELKANPAAKIDFLYQLMWQLLDDAFLAHRHPGQMVGVGEMQARLKSAACKINLKGFGPLSDYTFTGAKGLQMLLERIVRDHRNAPKLRQQYLFLAVVKDCSFDKMGSFARLLDGSSMMLGQSTRRPMILNDIGSENNEGPFLMAAVYGFNRPTDDYPRILKWALQPLVSDSLFLPVNSWLERMLVGELVKRMDMWFNDSSVVRSYKMWIYKPVLPSQDPMTGMWVQPQVSLVAKNAKGERCRVAFRVNNEETELGAYRRTYDHVHTMDDFSDDLPAECDKLFKIGLGVFEQHFEKLRREAEEQESLAAGQSVGQRMREREQELMNYGHGG